jgi:hypothetical protein
MSTKKHAKGKLFGKPRKDVVKHPGSYGHHSAKQINRDIKKGGKLGKKAGLAKAFATMRREKKAKRHGGRKGSRRS